MMYEEIANRDAWLLRTLVFVVIFPCFALFQTDPINPEALIPLCEFDQTAFHIGERSLRTYVHRGLVALSKETAEEWILVIEVAPRV